MHAKPQLVGLDLDRDLEAPGLESEPDSQASPGLISESNLISDQTLPILILLTEPVL